MIWTILGWSAVWYAFGLIAYIVMAYGDYRSTGTHKVEVEDFVYMAFGPILCIFAIFVFMSKYRHSVVATFTKKK